MHQASHQIFKYTSKQQIPPNKAFKIAFMNFPYLLFSRLSCELKISSFYFLFHRLMRPSAMIFFYFSTLIASSGLEINFLSQKKNVKWTWISSSTRLNDSWERSFNEQKTRGSERERKKFNYDNNKLCDEIVIESHIAFYRFATVIHWPTRNARSFDCFQRNANGIH